MEFFDNYLMKFNFANNSMFPMPDFNPAQIIWNNNTKFPGGWNNNDYNNIWDFVNNNIMPMNTLQWNAAPINTTYWVDFSVKHTPANPTLTPVTDTKTSPSNYAKNIPIPNTNTSFAKSNNMKTMNIKIGDQNVQVWGTTTTKFNKCQKEWLDLQQYMIQAAADMGLTLVYGDVTRTVAASNAGRAKKGSIVAPGGESPHNYGVAADIVLLKNGKPIDVHSSTQTEFAKRVKEYSNGRIEWGGDWKTNGNQERHHFNIKGWKNKYKKPQYLVG